MTEHSRLTCSVIIPCHNEQDNIRECVKRVPDLGPDTEVVLVDDGSTDETRAVALSICNADPRVRLIAANMNQG